MANPAHLVILKQGIKKWNAWRRTHHITECDLRNINLSNKDLRSADLHNANLYRANFKNANLLGANLNGANLNNANLSSANLILTQIKDANLSHAKLNGANFGGADLRGSDMSHARLNNADLENTNLNDINLQNAFLKNSILDNAKMKNANLSGAYLKNSSLKSANLEGANLTSADLEGADLSFANFQGADLSYVNLSRSILVETNFSCTTIAGCNIYGISAWKLNLENTIQKDLVITKHDEPNITVDNLLVAQFIYIVLNNNNIRDVLNAVTKKGVLILGSFSEPNRKNLLHLLKEKLRAFDLLPIVFDFECPTDKDYTETIQTLAGMSMFVIADITSPRSIPLELEAIVKHFKIPYVPIIDISVDQRPFAMLVDSQNSFHWVLPTLQYQRVEDLLDDENLKKYIIDPVNIKREELRKAKKDEPESMLIPTKNSIPH